MGGEEFVMLARSTIVALAALATSLALPGIVNAQTADNAFIGACDTALKHLTDPADQYQRIAARQSAISATRWVAVLEVEITAGGARQRRDVDCAYETNWNGGRGIESADWRAVRINGKTVDEHAGDALQKLRRSGS
jgi:hypothetical protein